MKKPLESLSPYFRSTAQIYFENPHDMVLDMTITNKDCKTKNNAYLAYKIENSFLMLV